MNPDAKLNHQNVVYAKQRTELNFARTGNLWKKVSCTVNAATSTPSFLGNFITDKIPDGDDPSTDTSSDSPVFYKSSSSTHKSVACPRPSESTREVLTPNSLFESTKIDHINSSTTNTSEYLLSTKSTFKNSYKLSNSTSNDTFGFLFPFNKNQRRFETNKGCNISKVSPIELVGESSPRYYSNVLLSAKKKTIRKVNFTFPQPLVSKNDFNEKDTPSRLNDNRKASSFFFPSKNVEYDNYYDHLSKSNFTKLISIKSKKPLTDTVEPRSRSYLPWNPGGDTCDNNGDQILILPYNNGSGKIQQQQIPTSSFHKEVTTQTVPLSETSKVRFSGSTDLNKPQKIFSQMHSCPQSTKEMVATKYIAQKELRNHSIETMKFFHKSLVLEDY